MHELNETPKFTRYNIESTLGSGGMGTVYLAHHNILNRSVALKVPKRELAQNEIFVERFLREARALGTLNHPHIVTVYDAGIEQSIPYIAMEYVAGDTLANSLLHAGQIDIILAISWGLQMAKALSYLHNQQILHRDLKSANVIIDRVGNAVIADFGIAQIEEDSNLTRGMLGTPAYVSPEQAKGAALDARSDLYSLGVILYECLTGCLPFRAENSLALIQKVIHETPGDIWNHRPETPPWLCDVVNKCLEKDPVRRFQDGAELAGALQQGLPDSTALMRSEPADTIVSHLGDDKVTVADQHRAKAYMSLANSFRQPPNLYRAQPFIDPSPTVTMYGGSQIIKPEKRESAFKTALNPLSAMMTVVILAALFFLPINQLPPSSAKGEQNTAEVGFPFEANQSTTALSQHPDTQDGLLPSAYVDSSVHLNTPSGVAGAFPDSMILSALPEPADSSQHAGPQEPNDFLSLTTSEGIDSLEIYNAEDSKPDSHNNENKIFAALLEQVSDTASSSPEVESVQIERPAVTALGDSEELDASQFDVDVSLLEDQLAAQSELKEAGEFDNRLPHSIVMLSELKNRTELVRALAMYQAQKVLLFGSKTNVKEPDLAFIFLINKENKKIRGLLAPSPEGWTDIYSGKIVTEEQGRFYEREPNTEVTLKWWLHDVTPIWVELKQTQKMVPRPEVKKGKKRLGW